MTRRFRFALGSVLIGLLVAVSSSAVSADNLCAAGAQEACVVATFMNADAPHTHSAFGAGQEHVEGMSVDDGSPSPR